jgi:hypothetical protein
MVQQLWSPNDGDQIGLGIRELRFSNAREMLLALNPLSGLFEDPSRWIYRGHADGAWRLLPSFHRDELWKRLTRRPEAFVPSETPEEQRVTLEKELYRRFVVAIDAGGLRVPGGLQVGSLLDRVGDPWPSRHFLPVLALAQHYGLPTRLLDWSRQARVAAYFAAQPSDADELVIWALDADYISEQHIAFRPTIKVAVTARADNANLHAQSGLFTFYRRSPDQLRTVDEVVSHALSTDWKEDAARCVMRKFVLDARERTRMLALLTLDGVSALTMFPSYSGAAQSVVEQIWCLREDGSWLPDDQLQPAREVLRLDGEEPDSEGGLNDA